jgi:acetyl-CoA acetyltransferase
MSWLTGVGLTSFGRHEGHTTLDLMTDAANLALADSGLERRDVDGLICGYSTTMPHIMLSTLFAEHFGVQPRYAHAVQVGGATGLAMLMLAHLVVQGGAATNILVVAGENRLTGQTRDVTMQTLAQAGESRYEVPLGPTVPAYYGMVASRYMREFSITESDLAELAVLMRTHARGHPGAHLREPIRVEDVLASTPIASPLKLMDCCPISDGGAAFIVSKEPVSEHSLKIRSASQMHTHQHVSAANDLTNFGAGPSMRRALSEASVKIGDVGYAAIYDSFTITLAILLEEIGLAERGASGRMAVAGYFSLNGEIPLNTHGGLLSYGHCGVAGALAHVAEAQIQMTRRAGPRQIEKEPTIAMLHGDGGIMSSHVSLIMERVK